MSKRQVRKYKAEFEDQAVELGRRIGISRAAQQLGVHVPSLHGWKKKSDQKNGSSKDAQSENQEQELKQLRKENEELKKVNYIFKRAAAFFSQDSLPQSLND